MSNLAPVAPGAYVSTATAAPNPYASPRTANWFVTGECQSGPVGVPIPVHSITDFINFCGTRQSYSYLYDSLDEFFADGGQQAWVSRVVGPSAVSATVSLNDKASGSPLPTLSVTASGPGVYGNSLQVIVAAGTATNSYTLTITLSGATIAVSPNLFSPQDAVTWATTSTPWTFPVVIANLGSSTVAPNNNPANGTFSLVSGADDLTDVTETQWTAALTAFNTGQAAGLPGQVSAPGHGTAAGWQALLAHASSYNRFALLDDTDSATASAIVANVTSAQTGAVTSATPYATMLAPWVNIPGIPQTAVGGSPALPTRTVPPAALVAALCARNDQGNDCNVAPAGANGQSVNALSVTQTYVNADRATLDAAGVSVIRTLNGVVQLYGNKTISLDPNWTILSNQRMRMQLTDVLQQVAQGFMFSEIDGQGHTLAAFAGALSGVLQGFWTNGSLYGQTATQAFNVNVGSAVNTSASISAGQLNAQVAVRLSPAAEWVYITITRYPVTQPIPS